MTWSATERYDIRPAPSGLALVQELLNTTSIAGMDDLLVNPNSAQKWVDEALGSWAITTGREPVKLSLSDSDRDALRSLRADLLSAVNTAEQSEIHSVQRSVSLGIVWSPEGVVDLEPRGEGWRFVAAAVYLECFIAQHADTWRRLKTCRSEVCASAFYDNSRNNSGVWHNVKVCGNAVNLRASRARRRIT